MPSPGVSLFRDPNPLRFFPWGFATLPPPTMSSWSRTLFWFLLPPSSPVSPCVGPLLLALDVSESWCPACLLFGLDSFVENKSAYDSLLCPKQTIFRSHPRRTTGIRHSSTLPRKRPSLNLRPPVSIRQHSKRLNTMVTQPSSSEVADGNVERATHMANARVFR